MLNLFLCRTDIAATEATVAIALRFVDSITHEGDHTLKVECCNDSGAINVHNEIRDLQGLL